jgi:hypothetical protein
MTGLIRSADHRYSWDDGPWLPGVTSVIGKVDKSGPLINWAKGVTADAALNDLDALQAMSLARGKAVAKAYLVAHATAESDSAKDIGSQVHRAAEAVSRGQEPDLAEEHRPWLDAYQRFLSDWRPGMVSLERYVANLTVGYGGTFDWIGVLDGKLTLGDTKTGKGIYAETRLQLAALGRAEFIGQPGDPKQYRMPRIEQYAILHLRPDAYERGYQLYRVDINEADFAAFCGALNVYRWDRERPSKGEPMHRVKEKVA